MPKSRYIRVTIGDNEVVVTDPADLPIAIDYNLEDPDNYQDKPSSQAIAVKIPATLENDRASGTFRSPDSLDLTTGEVFRSYRPFNIEESGVEIMTGKAILTKGTHTDRPVSYEYNFFGDNADWKIDMEEMTFYDVLQHINFVLSKGFIMSSWAFDGTDENLPFVFAPVRYRAPMGGYKMDGDVQVPEDTNMEIMYMKPSLSKYFILYWAFKAVGYKISSAFLDSNFFRRQVMPWTWGNFLSSEGTKLTAHMFRAKSTRMVRYNADDGQSTFFWDLDVSNDSTDGMFDNNDDYQYDAVNKEMKWTYKTPDYGSLTATFSMQINYDARLNGSTSSVKMYVYWYKNGSKVGESTIVELGGTLVGGRREIDIKEVFFSVPVQQGDIISAKIYVSTYGAKLGYAALDAEVLQYQLDYFNIPLGGTVDFDNFTGLKKYKITEFLRGLIDEFNLQVNTDSINKQVIIEPTHPWAAGNNMQITTPGYFKDDFIDWNGKEDLSKEWEMENFSDANREFTLKYKDDRNDGILKVVQDRHVIVLGSGKYVFPERFKTGKKEQENRFFSATMHYEVDQWRSLGTGANAGIAPQMVCMVPENISNTSNSESANTFEPKSCYYKGVTSGVGAWKFDGDVYQTFPYMFAVNYKPGGENDPVLSYSDENINGVIAKGLLKRFFIQRLAIMRNGQWYSCWFRLKNVDVAHSLHREYKSYKGHRWELVQIRGYKPLKEESTGVLLRKWEPVLQRDYDNVFPSNSALTGGSGINNFDMKYNKLVCLPTDIPT